MKLIPQTKPPLFNLLSIGQRGVGKTVFLAGSYLELQRNSQANKSESLGIKYQDKQDKENLDSILNYIARTGEYPPPTMKITDFNFELKQRSSGKSATLCYFHWWDIPGEYCDFNQPDYQKMVLNSHSCCVFINAYQLVNDQNYPATLEGIVKQVVSIAYLVDPNVLNYRFALIFTQCDRLASSPISRLQIEQNLQPLITSLEMAKVNYQRFYSAIPIIELAQGSGARKFAPTLESPRGFTLNPSGSAAPFVWLVSELYQKHPFAEKTLATALEQTSSSKQRFLSTPRRSILLLTVGLGLLVGVTTTFLLLFGRFNPSVEKANTPDQQISQYQEILQSDPNNFQILTALANLYLERGQLEQALPLMEKIVQQKPDNLDWQFNLAMLYELTEQTPKAETVYDQILVRNKKHFRALVGKAELRGQQGDLQAAKTLFQEAEQVAPNSELKTKVRAMAQRYLPSTPSNPSAQN